MNEIKANTIIVNMIIESMGIYLTEVLNFYFYQKIIKLIGVYYKVNYIDLIMKRLVEKFSGAYDKLVDKLDAWITNLFLMLPNIILAILVMAVTIILAKYTRQLFLKILQKISSNQAVNKLLGTVATFIVVLIGLFIALDMMKLDKLVTSLLAGAGVAGLVLGLAFQEPIMNTVAGVVLAVRRVYRTGDLIKTNSYFGEVDEKALYYTSLKLPSGQLVVIPNKLIVQNPMVNYSVINKRRVELDCGVHYSSDLDKVEQLVRKAAEAVDEVEKSEKIEFFYLEFGEYAIVFRLRFWIKKVTQGNYYKVRSEVLKKIKESFDQEGIQIPYPIKTVHLNEENKK